MWTRTLSRATILKMKRNLSNTASHSPSKRQRPIGAFNPNKVATQSAAAAVDNDPPLPKLLKAMENSVQATKGDAVVYWMRMGDLRISDNRALSLASKQAHKDAVPLVVLFILSPQDYIAHDRSPRRIDFTLRNLTLIKANRPQQTLNMSHYLQESLFQLQIPLHTILQPVRRAVPSRVISFLEDLNCTYLFANIEYEVDELRRDIQICSLARPKHIQVQFVHDKCIIEPGVVLTKQNKAYAVYSPYQKRWLEILNGDHSIYLEDCPKPLRNPESVTKSSKIAPLFNTSIPPAVPGFKLQDEDKARMAKIWPAGEESAEHILRRFLHNKSDASRLGVVDPIDTELSQDSAKQSRISKYKDNRDRADMDTTSRLSPYLSAGVISARQCIRSTLALQKVKKVDGGSDTGIGRWVQELAWRDFYVNVLTAFPRVSMGRPFLEKFAGVVWEDHCDPSDQSKDAEMFQKWKEGKTGYPIVDAAMRCVNEMGWVHNRMRMIAAMFLTKDLMIDWRIGEKYFMEHLIDGDLASNNGGWQWSASTGVDPCPYFRIFNPYSQSPKADPSGDFIRHFVPELKKLKGKDLYNPSAETARALGYPRPIVKHDEARAIALRRYQNPGTK